MTKNLTDFTPETFREYITAELPPIIAREKVSTYTGNFIASGTMANLDSQGLGPKQLPNNGRKVAYVKKDFIEWLINRIFYAKNKGETK